MSDGDRVTETRGRAERGSGSNEGPYSGQALWRAPARKRLRSFLRVFFSTWHVRTDTEAVTFAPPRRVCERRRCARRGANGFFALQPPAELSRARPGHGPTMPQHAPWPSDFKAISDHGPPRLHGHARLTSRGARARCSLHGNSEHRRAGRVPRTAPHAHPFRRPGCGGGAEVYSTLKPCVEHETRRERDAGAGRCSSAAPAGGVVAGAACTAIEYLL